MFIIPLYILIIFLILYFSHILTRVYSRGLVAILSVMLFILFMSFSYSYIKLGLSIDIERYAWNFIYRYPDYYYSSTTLLQSKYEVGFLLLSKVISFFYSGDNGIVYVVIFHSINYLLLFKITSIISRNCNNSNFFYVLLFIVCSLLFLQNQYLLKQSISTGIFQISLLLFLENKEKKRSWFFLIVMCVSIFFHKAAILPVILTFTILFLEKRSKIYNVIVVFGSLLFLNNYLNQIGYSLDLNIITSVRGLPFMFILFATSRSKISMSSELIFLRKMLYLTILFYMGSLVDYWSFRIALFFIPFSIQYLIKSVEHKHISRNNTVITLFLLLIVNIFELVNRVGGI